jgi:5-methylcytosine-specific restriction endonuclease McrA
VFEEVRSALTTLEGVVREFEPKLLEAGDARTMLELFAKGERLCAAGKALTATRVEATGAYRGSGHRSAGDLLASVSGTTVGAAESTLKAAKRVEDLPATNEAFRSGDLSEAQTKEITAAASKSPKSEDRLVKMAKRRRPMKGLKEECARVIAASVEDDAAWDRHLHETRSAHLFTDRGHLRLDLRLAPDRAIGFHAAVEAETDLLFREARGAGRKEPRAAYMADAIANLVDGGPRKPIDARIDVSDAALERGHVAEGEKCEIPGLGPIPVVAAKRLLRDARVTLLVRDDTDKITHVSSVTRTVPAKLRRWLEATYPVCGRQGCENTIGLRIDHIHEYSKGGVLDEHNAWRICGPCDDLKQHHRWRVIGTPAHYDLVPPDHAELPASVGVATDPDPP